MHIYSLYFCVIDDVADDTESIPDDSNVDPVERAVGEDQALMVLPEDSSSSVPQQNIKSGASNDQNSQQDAHGICLMYGSLAGVGR